MVKILFLHGYAQTPEEIASKSRQIQRALPQVEFYFPPAAIELISYDGDIDDRNRGSSCAIPRYSWNYPEQDMSTHLINLEATIAHIVPILETHGPFDGIMGFSQGAAVAAAITSILERAIVKIAHPACRFAILFCGARPSGSEFDPIYTQIKTPSLHLIGRQDVMVPRSRSLDLAETFESPAITYHPGNHFIPQGQAYTQAVADFVLSKCNRQSLAGPSGSAMLIAKDSATRPKADRSNTGSKPPGSRFRLVRKSSFVRTRSITC